MLTHLYGTKMEAVLCAGLELDFIIISSMYVMFSGHSVLL